MSTNPAVPNRSLSTVAVPAVPGTDASRSRNQADFTPAVPGSRSQPFPVRSLSTAQSFPPVPSDPEQNLRAVPPSTIRGNGSETVLPFRSWLADLRARRITISNTPNGLRLHGPMHLVQPTDHAMLARHRHALTLAATGSHADWWRHVTGHDPFPPLASEVPDDCATCGAPLDWLDASLLAWCNDHVDPQLVADTLAWRTAA